LTWLFCVGWWPIVFLGARRTLARRRHDSDGTRFNDEREENVEYYQVRELRTAVVLPWSTVADAFHVVSLLQFEIGASGSAARVSRRCRRPTSRGARRQEVERGRCALQVRRRDTRACHPLLSL